MPALADVQDSYSYEAVVVWKGILVVVKMESWCWHAFCLLIWFWNFAL